MSWLSGLLSTDIFISIGEWGSICQHWPQKTANFCGHGLRRLPWQWDEWTINGTESYTKTLSMFLCIRWIHSSAVLAVLLRDKNDDTEPEMYPVWNTLRFEKSKWNITDIQMMVRHPHHLNIHLFSFVTWLYVWGIIKDICPMNNTKIVGSN